MKKVILFTSIIVGAIVGVGFISGKEVVTFFARFGVIGLLFSVFAGVCFGVLIYYFSINNKNVSTLIYSKKPQNCVKTCEKWHQNNEKLQISVIFQKVLLCVYVVISAVMISGFRSLFLNFLPAIFVELVVFLILGCLIFLLQFKTGDIGKITFSFLLVFLVIIVVLFFQNVKNFEFVYKKRVNTIYVFCLMSFYVSMNVFTSLPLILNAGKLLNKKQCKYVSFLIGITMTILLMVCTILLFNKNGAMPILDIIENKILYIIYVVLIVFGLLTTVYSSLQGCINLCKNGNTFKNRVLVIYFSYIFSSFGFSVLVEKVYPLLGFITMLALIVIYLSIDKNRKIA